MQLLVFILLILFHFFTGSGVLKLFRIEADPAEHFSLSAIIGIFTAALILFILQLLYIPLTASVIFPVLLVAMLLLNIPNLYSLKNHKLKIPSLKGIRLYEWPYILVITFLVLLSGWRCYYLPPQARDFLSGPEAIAAFAVKEHTLINSIFSLDLASTNNQFKSPFLHTLQLLYKLSGFEFGGIWLCLLSSSFFIFIYARLRKTVHPAISGLLVLLLISTPELYGYSYIVLYDYSNMIFFFLGYYFLAEYLQKSQNNTLYFSAFLFGAAVYIRSETLILLFMLLPLIFINGYQKKEKAVKWVIYTVLFYLPAVISYTAVIHLYNNHYLPRHYQVENMINPDFWNIELLWNRIAEVWSRLIVGTYSISLYGYCFYLLLGSLFAELVFFRAPGQMGRIWLYGILIIILGLCFIGFLFPIMDIEHSTKRGLFKVLPFITCYLSHNKLIGKLSSLLAQWEHKQAPSVPAKGKR